MLRGEVDGCRSAGYTPFVARRIAVITTSRADYSHLFWVLHELREHPDVELRLIVTGAHLSEEFGRAG